MSSADEPRQIVRAQFPGETIPAYSTVQLLLGVRHVVLKPEKTEKEIVQEAEIKAKQSGGLRGGATRKMLAEARFHGHEKRLRELLDQAFTDSEIEEEIGINRKAVQRYIAARPDLKGLSAKRRKIRLQRSIKNFAAKSRKETQAAIDRFERRLPLMKEMIMQGRTNVYISLELRISERLVTQYITKSPELKILSEERFQARKLAPKKLDEIRRPLMKMLATGAKDAVIAKALGMSRHGVWRYKKMIEQENNHVEG